MRVEPEVGFRTVLVSRTGPVEGLEVLLLEGNPGEVRCTIAGEDIPAGVPHMAAEVDNLVEAHRMVAAEEDIPVEVRQRVVAEVDSLEGDTIAGHAAVEDTAAVEVDILEVDIVGRTEAVLDLIKCQLPCPRYSQPTDFAQKLTSLIRRIRHGER